jgi:hypothetical protein
MHYLDVREKRSQNEFEENDVEIQEVDMLMEDIDKLLKE